MMNTIIGGDREGTTVHHNIVHDAMSLRDHANEYWGMAGIRVDTGPSDIEIHDNVIWNTGKDKVLILRFVRPREANYGDQDIQVYDNTVDGEIRTYAARPNGEMTDCTTSDNMLLLKPETRDLPTGHTDVIGGYDVVTGVADRGYRTSGETAGTFGSGVVADR